MTSQATPVRGPDGVVELGGGIAARRARHNWKRDTAAVTISSSAGGYGDARVRRLTLALGRVVGA